MANQPSNEHAGDGGEDDHDPDRGLCIAYDVSKRDIIAVVHRDQNQADRDGCDEKPSDQLGDIASVNRTRMFGYILAHRSYLHVRL
jgi:hypothetical protein